MLKEKGITIPDPFGGRYNWVEGSKGAEFKRSGGSGLSCPPSKKFRPSFRISGRFGWGRGPPIIAGEGAVSQGQNQNEEQNELKDSEL